jgi:hypothetical protein
MSEIDDLMNLDPLELEKSPQALDKIIDWMRKQRANFESGIKPKKGEGGLTAKEILNKINVGKPKEEFKRRI